MFNKEDLEYIKECNEEVNKLGEKTLDKHLLKKYGDKKYLITNIKI